LSVAARLASPDDSCIDKLFWSVIWRMSGGARDDHRNPRKD